MTAATEGSGFATKRGDISGLITRGGGERYRHNVLKTRTEDEEDKKKRKRAGRAGRALCTLEVSNRKSRGRGRQVSNRKSDFHNR